MENLSGVLFPHTFLKKRDLQRLSPHLEGLKVCQPWFMESLYTEKNGDDLPFLEILRPPEGLRPQEDFLKLLSEYRRWMNDNLKRGDKSFARYAQEQDPENSSWAIRQMIKNRQPSSDVSPSDVLKWHLVLHLAREHEESLEEAEELYSSIMGQPGPLSEALWENAPSEVSAPGSKTREPNNLPDESLLPQIIEAWLGLFSSHLKDGSILITLDKRIIEHLSSHFEDACSGLDSRQNDYLSDISRTFPEIKADGEAYHDKVRHCLSGKTAICPAAFS